MINCGHCPSYHESVSDVRLCADLEWFHAEHGETVEQAQKWSTV